MGCTYNVKANHLWSMWYTLFVVLLQGYLIYLGLQRSKLYEEVKWPTGGYPNVWLKVYYIVYFVCLPACFFLFACGCFKTGNIAGDNERLGDREDRILEVSRNSRGEKKGCLHGMKSLYQHAPPLPQTCHLISAILQLFAQQVMISQLYRSGFINSGDFLNTELDFIYQRARQLATNLPTGDSLYQGFRLTAHELSDYPLSPNLLPLLMNARLFGIPLEFANLVVALFVFSISYAAVFWRINKKYSFLFSLFLLLFSISQVFSYISFSILLRVQETNIGSLRPVGLGQHIYLRSDSYITKYVFHPYAILASYCASFLLPFCALIVYYNHGYNLFEKSLADLQARNHIRSGSITGTTDYSNYTRKSSQRYPKNRCCGGYGPIFSGVLLCCLYFFQKLPTLYAIGTFYTTDSKPLLATIIIVETVFCVFWILLFFMLVLYRRWAFNVAHKAHQLYGLQKGGATGHIRGNENPSQLKNAVIVVHKDHMFVTDDNAAKQTFLRHIQKDTRLDATTEHMWSKNNGNHNHHNHQGSPLTRRVPADEAGKPTPEMSRLMNTSTDDNSASYPTMSRGSHLANTTMSRGNSSPPEAAYGGTLQRSQNPYMGTLQRNQMAAGGTLQRAAQPQWVPDSYASIHKQQKADPYQRRGSNDNPHSQYGHMEIYSNYGTYARIPNQTRVPVPPPSQQGNQVHTMRINGANYGLADNSTLQRRPSDNNHPQIGGVRQSPLLSERTASSGIGTQSSISSKDRSPYQQASMKLSSFNNREEKGGGVYGTAATQWIQRAPPGQPSQLLWNQNKSSISASSSQQEQCFTPTSTLTSQGSTSTYSQQTPTPGSPQTQNFTKHEGGGGIYGTLGDEIYGEKTLQKRIGTTTLRHAVKATGPTVNFSSPITTNGTPTKDEFATSIV